jgi:hypothetical protein
MLELGNTRLSRMRLAAGCCRTAPPNALQVQIQAVAEALHRTAVKDEHVATPRPSEVATVPFHPPHEGLSLILLLPPGGLALWPVFGSRYKLMPGAPAWKSETARIKLILRWCFPFAETKTA